MSLEIYVTFESWSSGLASLRTAMRLSLAGCRPACARRRSRRSQVKCIRSIYRPFTQTKRARQTSTIPLEQFNPISSRSPNLPQPHLHPPANMDLSESQTTFPSDSEVYDANYDANHSNSQDSEEQTSHSSSPLILYSPPTFLSILRGAAINLVLPFVNGLMLGFGELFAHEAAFRLGWGGTRVRLVHCYGRWRSGWELVGLQKNGSWAY